MGYGILYKLKIGIPHASIFRIVNTMAMGDSISNTLMIAIAILITSLNFPSMLLEDYLLEEDFQVGVQIGLQMIVRFFICKYIERDTLTERLRIE
ncbi:hypothetical protein [Extibacter muris]|uniref:hypothetical protein n=1 Tax=Extibacter muris TaxID=1796622 RepID=UPI002109E20D|nr:hypothetical protein [Extibacter muris]